MEIYIYNGYDINGDASDGRTVSWNHITSSIILDTGGTAGKTNMNFVRVWMPVWDKVAQGWPQIPASNVTMWGRASEATNDGYWTAFLQDHTIVDVTPTVSGNWMHQFSWTNYDGGTHYSERTHLVFQEPQYSPYDYPHAPNPRVQKTRPTIWWNGANITDQTNVIWVGEKLSLTCLLSEHIEGIFITNYFWQVPGAKIKDWVLSGPSTNCTSAVVVPWHDGTNRLAAVTQFCWTRDNAQILPVICTVQVRGQTMVAKAYFDVRRPDASWRVEAKFGNVVVTNSGQCVSSIFPNHYYLLTGMNCTTNDVAVQFQFSNLDLKGFTGPYEASCVQVASVNWKWNMSEPPLMDYSRD